MKRFFKGGLASVIALCMTVGLMGSASSAPISAREDLMAAVGVNVRNSGAVGNGTANDTQAVKAAIDLAVSDGTGSVYFPDGTYRLSGSLSVPRSVELIFASQATLSLDEGAVLSCNGTLTAGNQTVFTGSGKVSGNPLTAVGNPMWFGAKGDGKTDDTAAFQKAIDLFDHVVVPYSEKGYVVSDIRISRSNSKLQGEGEERKAKLIAAPHADKMITVANSCIDVEYLAFEMAAAPTATCLYYDDSKFGIELCNARYIDAVDAYCVLTDANHKSNMVVTSKFEHFNCVDGRGTAVVMNDMWGFIFMTNAVIDYSNSASKHGITVDFPGFFIKDNAGAILTDIRVIGDPNGSDQAHGFDVRPGAAMWFRRCSVENSSGNGFSLNGGSWVYLLECSVKNSQENAFNLKNCNYLQLIDTIVEFTDANDVDGVYFDGGSYNLVQNLSVTNAGRNALTLQRTIRTACNDVVATDCKHYAVHDKGQNCSFSNISGPISSDRVH